MKSESPSSWGDVFSTISILRSDSERLEKLARPRENRTPYQKRLEHKYEVLTRALDALEREMKSEE